MSVPGLTRPVLLDSSPGRGRTSGDVLCGSCDDGNDSVLFRRVSSEGRSDLLVECSRGRQIVENVSVWA